MGIMLVVSALAAAGILSLALLFFSLITGLLLARIRVRLFFTPIAYMIPFLVLLALIQVFALPQLRVDAVVVWQKGFLIITDRSLLGGALLMGRFIVIVLGLSLFSFSTSSVELMHGIEHLLRPLQKIRFPAHELALVVNISVRFLPMLVSEAERIMKAQAARGADFGQGRLNFIRRLKNMLPLFVPLFVISLRNAQNMVEAMESRCYMGGRGRTRLIELKASNADILAVFICIVVVTMSVLLSVLHVDRYFVQWMLS
jgi:energy-coupling factor transport system permease protein